MKKNIFNLASVFIFTTVVLFTVTKFNETRNILFYKVNGNKNKVEMFWRNEKNEPFKNVENLKKWLNLNNKELIFGVNGGMYLQNNEPLGLYIEKGEIKKQIDTANGEGNFYVKPNGIFYILKNKIAVVCQTSQFSCNDSVVFATQSGPMLVIENKIHPSFNKKSTNEQVRNGVGILPNNDILFAMATKPINFYNFAKFFKNKGCKNALYLDGYVSRTYLPEKQWKQTDGNFAVIIGLTQQKNNDK